jgi:hypothetical protein
LPTIDLQKQVQEALPHPDHHSLARACATSESGLSRSDCRVELSIEKKLVHDVFRLFVVEWGRILIVGDFFAGLLYLE